MSIFGAIKHAIFGDKGLLGTGIGATPAAATPPAASAPAPSAAQPSGVKPAMPQMASPAAPAGAQPVAAPAPPVDVEAVLTQIAHRKSDPRLNWRTSIVDLMKLLDLDPSLKNREELATELGYTGAKDGSAEMNIWLHKRVMEELAKSGGTVPADLKD